MLLGRRNVKKKYIPTELWRRRSAPCHPAAHLNTLRRGGEGEGGVGPCITHLLNAPANPADPTRPPPLLTDFTAGRQLGEGQEVTQQTRQR